MESIFEVGIGLILAVAMLAVVVSSIVELLSALMRLRARSLKQGIARMLDNQALSARTATDPVRTPVGGSPATDAVMRHPLVKAMSSPRAVSKPPSYIDAITFGTALLGSTFGDDVLVGKACGSSETDFPTRAGGLTDEFAIASWKASGGEWPRYYEAVREQPTKGMLALVALAGGEAKVRERIDALTRAGDPAAAPLESAAAKASVGGHLDVGRFMRAITDPLISVRDAVEDVESGLERIKLVNAHLGASLQALWDQADRKFDAFRHGIEDWYDREMSRVSGWYSRRTQWILVGFGIGLALLLNVSLITVGKKLWEDPTVREAGLSIAESVTATTVAPTTDSATDGTLEVDGSVPPAVVESDDTIVGGAAPADGTTTTTIAGAPTEGELTPASVQDLAEAGYPIGWNASAWPGWGWYLVLHLLGIVMAGIATSFGAPFWFDLLNRFVNLRAAGKPPPTAAATRPTGRRT